MAYAKPVLSTPPIPSPVIFKNIDNYLSRGAQKRQQNRFVLCIKGVSSDLDEGCLKNILSEHGNVLAVAPPKSVHCSYYFAECATEKDFEAILKGMQYNKYKLKIEPKTEKINKSNNDQQYNNDDDISKTTSNNRQNHNNQSNNKQHHSKDKNHHRHGRGHRRHSENDSLMNNKENYQRSEEGYNSKKNASEKSSPLKLGSCRTCKKESSKICEKCDEFYCSVECQIRDWQTHRFYCFKMPKLITVTNNEKKEILENIQISNKQKNNMSINELKQVVKENTFNDSNNKQKNMSSYGFNHGKQSQNGKTVSETGAIPKKIQSPNNRNDKNTTQNKRNDIRFNKMDVKPVIDNAAKNTGIGHHSENLPENKTQSLVKPLLLINKPTLAEVPKSGEIVIMTHFEQPDMAYIRSNEVCCNKDYINTVNKVHKCSDNAKFLKQLPQVNEYVITESSNIWSRAIVVENENSEKILVQYVDYGNKEYKKLSELKELVPECYNLKQYPVLIHLKNFTNGNVNDDCLQCYINDFSQLKIIYKSYDVNDNKIMAELYNLETNENINNKCIDVDKSVMFKDIAKEILPASENVPIVVVGQSMIENGFIHCISGDEFHKLHNLNEEMKKYAESNYDHYTPKKDEMCIAKSDNPAFYCTWYRACCDEIENGDNPTLFFPDYGFFSKVPIQHIRKYPKNITFPFKTNDCLITGLEFLMDANSINPALEERLRQMLPLNKIIMVQKVEYMDDDGDAVTLNLPKIIDTLRQESLLEN